MREYGSQAVVWQTALNPVCALELLAEGSWSGSVCSARRRFPPGRSSTSWPSSAHRTGCSSSIRSASPDDDAVLPVGDDRARHGLAARHGRYSEKPIPSTFSGVIRTVTRVSPGRRKG